MIGAILAGVAAGLGIAIPVGAISVLIMETGIRSGFRTASAAGAGAASADGIYATLAAVFGVALAGLLAPWQAPLRAAAVVVLAGLGLHGLRSVVREAARARLRTLESVAPSRAGAAIRGPRSAGRTYAAFLGLTLLNPMTVAYFAALILGLGTTGSDPAEKIGFVAGAFGASLSWQTLIAAVGAALHRRLAPRLRLAVGVTGNAIVLLFAGVIAVGLIR